MFKLKNEGKPFHPMETGIGLHYMKENVEALGGTFSIDSNHGLGCSITINIPLLKDDF